MNLYTILYTGLSKWRFDRFSEWEEYIARFFWVPVYHFNEFWDVSKFKVRVRRVIISSQFAKVSVLYLQLLILLLQFSDASIERVSVLHCVRRSPLPESYDS